MRTSLWKALGATLAATAAALWWPPHAPLGGIGSLASDDRQQLHSALSQKESAITTLSARQEVLRIDRAEFDPFVGVHPVAPIATSKRPTAPSQSPQQLLVARTPQELNYRYLGQMTDPTGTTVAFLAHRERELTVTVGARLEEGTVVQSIEADGVTLRTELSDNLVVLSTARAAGSSTP